MTQHIENYCARSELLIRMLEGDLSAYCGETIKSEIRRILRYREVSLEPSTDSLADADE